MNRRSLFHVLLPLLTTLSLVACRGDLGATCYRDKDCSSALRCTRAEGATRGICAYPERLKDLGVDVDLPNDLTKRDSSRPDTLSDTRSPEDGPPRDLDAGGDIPLPPRDLVDDTLPPPQDISPAEPPPDIIFDRPAPDAPRIDAPRDTPPQDHHLGDAASTLPSKDAPPADGDS